MNVPKLKVKNFFHFILIEQRIHKGVIYGGLMRGNLFHSRISGGMQRR